MPFLFRWGGSGSSPGREYSRPGLDCVLGLLAGSADEVLGCCFELRLEPGMQEGWNWGAGGVSLVVRVDATAENQGLDRELQRGAANAGPAFSPFQVVVVNSPGDFYDEMEGFPDLDVGGFGDYVGP